MIAARELERVRQGFGAFGGLGLGGQMKEPPIDWLMDAGQAEEVGSELLVHLRRLLVCGCLEVIHDSEGDDAWCHFCKAKTLGGFTVGTENHGPGCPYVAADAFVERVIEEHAPSNYHQAQSEAG